MAKVGRSIPVEDPVPRSSWRDYLGELARAMLYVLAVLVIAGPTLIMILARAK